MAGNEIEIRVKSKDLTGPGTKSAKKNVEGIGDSAKRVGDIAQGVLASQVFDRMGQAAARGLKSTFTAAKDLGESVNAVNVSFGSSSKQILDWGQNNAASFGLSQRAFNQAVVPMGAILKNTGIDMGVVSDHTIGLTKRASDMASVFNVDVSEALDAIQAGLRGESDPLERFGVGLNAAAVEAKALADTGKESAAALTDQEKMLARVALIMEQTSQVQGDFANTSDDAANAQRIATAEMENAQATIGQAFLPVMAALAQAVATVARWFQALPGPMQTVAAVLLAIGAAALILIPKMVAVVIALRSVGVTASTTGKLMLGVLGPIGLLIAAGQALGDAFNDNDEQFAKLDKRLSKLVDEGKADQAKKELARLANAFDLLGMSQEEVMQQLPGYSTALEASKAEAKAAADAEGERAGKLGEAAAATGAATDALKDHVAALRAATDPVFGLLSAVDTLEDAQKAYNEALKEHGEDSDESRRAAVDLAKAVAGVEAAASDGELSFDAFQGQLRTWVRQGVLTANQAKAIEARVRDARKEADAFDGERLARLRAIIHQGSLNAAENALNRAARDRVAIIRAHATAGSNPSIGALMKATGGIVGANHAAEGGPRGGSDVFVGEQGMERVELPFGLPRHPGRPDAGRARRRRHAADRAPHHERRHKGARRRRTGGAGPMTYRPSWRPGSCAWPSTARTVTAGASRGRMADRCSPCGYGGLSCPRGDERPPAGSEDASGGR